MARTNVASSFKDAFLDLFAQMRYDDITVSAICNKAQGSRTSFYKHFASKNALFASILTGILIEPLQDFRRSSLTHKHPDIALSWADRIQYEHILAQKDFFKKALRECPFLVLECLMASYAELNKEHLSTWLFEVDECDYIATIAAAVHVAGIAHWIQNDFNMKPEELARLHYKWALRNWMEAYEGTSAYQEMMNS